MLLKLKKKYCYSVGDRLIIDKSRLNLGKKLPMEATSPFKN